MAPRLAAGAKVADVGCGSGKAVFEMARAFPHSDFHGYDSSEPAIGFAKAYLAQSGLRNVNFHCAAADTLPRDASFDFVLNWDSLHGLTDPAEAMRSIRASMKPGGTWLIVDINGMSSPEENYAFPLGALLYSFSVLDCLACSTCEDGGAALGNLGLPEPIARKMTAAAGFTRFTPRDIGQSSELLL